MSDEREGDRGPEDLFEDLDTFFAPIGDLDEEEPSPPVRPPTRTPGDLGQPPAEGEEEILPSGWTAGLDDLERETEPGEEAGPTVEDRFLTAPGDRERPGEAEPPEPSELAGEEWDRFNRALGEVEFGAEEPPVPGTRDAFEEATAGEEGLPEPEEPVPPLEEEPEPVLEGEPSLEEEGEPSLEEEGGPSLEEEPGPSLEEEMAAEEEAPALAGEEPGGLTLEDLQAVPPVYRDLAGPGEEEELAPAGVERGPFEEEGAPTPEAVEAAADQIAESIRRTPQEVEEDLLADLDRQAEGPQTVRVGTEEPFAGVPPEEASPPTGGRRALRVGAADTLVAGPSWQEPTSEEVAAQPEGPGAGRNIPAAFISALILAGLGIGSVALGKAPFAVFAGLIVLLAQGELYAAMVKARYQPATAVGLLFGGLILAAGYLEGEPAMLSMVALSVVFTFMWYMATPARARRNVLTNVGMTLLGVVYVPFFAAYVLVILSLPDGRALMLALLGLAFVNDIAAFAGGYLWGSRSLAPSISPRKSWEGLIIGTIVIVALGLAILPSIDAIGTVGRALALSLTVAVFGPLGDLAESLLKRDLRIKDMGTLLPGHGGALDRIDSALFAAPAAFYLFRLLF